MATFVYYWKTAKNERHEGEIEAPDREAAFALLRERGIHAIKVEPKGWETGKGRTVGFKRWIAGVLAAALLGGISTYLLTERQPSETRRPPRQFTSAYRSLIATTEDIRTHHKAALAKLNLDLLRNYALVEHTDDMSSILKETDEAYAVINYTRVRLKELFKDVYARFPSTGSVERTEAQRLYGELMQEIDADESRVWSDEYAVSFLQDHRGKWTTRKGQVEWSDPKLAAEFANITQYADPSTARWHKDFSQTIESNIVATPER